MPHTHDLSDQQCSFFPCCVFAFADGPAPRPLPGPVPYAIWQINNAAAFPAVCLRLQTDRHLGPFLGLYQIHSATLESGVLSAADVLAALAQLKAEKGWALGLSVSGARLVYGSMHVYAMCCCCAGGLAQLKAEKGSALGVSVSGGLGAMLLRMYCIAC
jgi:hypothetical protein